MKIGALDARNTADPPSLTMMELEGGSELSLGRWLTTPAVEADNHFHPLPGSLSLRGRGNQFFRSGHKLRQRGYGCELLFVELSVQ